jgi:hypothetical protein
MHARKELGIAKQSGYCSAALRAGKSHFTFEAKMKRDGTTLDGDRNVLCLAAATARETSGRHYKSLRFPRIEICATRHAAE